MKVVCLGSLCKKCKECRHYWLNNEGENQLLDYSTMGSCHCAMCGKVQTIKYACGDNGEYKMFDSKQVELSGEMALAIVALYSMYVFCENSDKEKK